MLIVGPSSDIDRAFLQSSAYDMKPIRLLPHHTIIISCGIARRSLIHFLGGLTHPYGDNVPFLFVHRLVHYVYLDGLGNNGGWFE